MIVNDLLRIEFTLPAADYDAAVLFLTDAVRHGWEESPAPDGATHFRTYLENHAEGREVARQIAERWPQAGLETEECHSRDWSESWRKFFTPIECGGRFEILPPWLADKRRKDMTPIVIEPKMAFGTGHHATTALCLTGLADLEREGVVRAGGTFLDLGAGSGILGIGLVKLGLSGRGVDIDPQAVACARENARANGVADRLELAVGSIKDVPADETFDVFVANILSKPLIFMAPAIVAHIRPGGCLVLSGILTEQAPEVVAAYRALGLSDPEMRTRDEWCALLWKRVEPEV